MPVICHFNEGYVNFRELSIKKLKNLFPKKQKCGTILEASGKGEAVLAEIEENKDFVLLNKINYPSDVKALGKDELPLLAQEIRNFLITHIPETGGHLASNLGVVEMTIALLRVLNVPYDHIIFDVGHQSYVYKMLTGRRDRFDTLRKNGGLSGFPKRSESEYDCFGTGHSSTSLSAALGFAKADKLKGSDAYTVAVVGDGAFTGGMIHEALNNCEKDMKLIILLNENEMSISKNIGRFATNIARMRTRTSYFKAKSITRRVVCKIPFIGKPLFNFIRDSKKAFKNLLYGSNYFEDLGLYYLGPVDGNNIDDMEALLREAINLGESVVIHAKTKKGCGLDAAEANPGKYHGIAPEGSRKKEHTFSEMFGNILTEKAKDNEKIVAITAAMSDGTGLETFKTSYPKRFFDVGIAEEHAVTFAAGLAAAGYRPVVPIYSTFLQRAYDNIIHDVALQSLPVVICSDRAGLNASDGATHHGIFDVAFASGIPGVKIYTPVTYKGLEMSLSEALSDSCPSIIRYPNTDEKQAVVDAFYSGTTEAADCGIGIRVYRNGASLEAAQTVIITHGKIVLEAISAADTLNANGIKTAVILAEFLKPYDRLAQLIDSELCEDPRHIILLEEEIRTGGFGMILSEQLRRMPRYNNTVFTLLSPENDFVVPKEDETIYDAAGVSSTHIIKAAESINNT